LHVTIDDANQKHAITWNGSICFRVLLQRIRVPTLQSCHKGVAGNLGLTKERMYV
jgi:hypothetical protein